MKKQILLLLLSGLIVSCGGKNDKKEEEINQTKPKIEEKADCGCNEISGPNYDNLWTKNEKSFTGICVDKDQNDSIILKRIFKNGYQISEIVKEKIKGKYITTSDIKFENGKEYNGYKVKNEFSDGIQNYTYFEFKDGKTINQCIIFIDTAEDVRTICGWVVKNGQEMFVSDENNNYPEISRPKCMPDGDKPENFGSHRGWTLKHLDKEIYDKVITELQKEIPGFIYLK